MSPEGCLVGCRPGVAEPLYKHNSIIQTLQFALREESRFFITLTLNALNRGFVFWGTLLSLSSSGPDLPGADELPGIDLAHSNSEWSSCSHILPLHFDVPKFYNLPQPCISQHLNPTTQQP